MSTCYVTIHYGPCDSFSTLHYKPQKLKGLTDGLRRLGYRVDLHPIEYRDFCVLEMCGHEVFRCNINHLCFNMPYHQDPVARRAVDAVLESTVKLNHASSYQWLYATLKDEMLKRNQRGPKEYFPFEIDIKPFNLDCINCCGILLAKKTDEERELEVESVIEF